MIRALLCLSVVVLSGCASTWYAGVDVYKIAPLVNADGVVTGCCTLTVESGKEASAVSASFTKVGDNYTITLNESQVEAFKGQAIAGSVASDVAGAISNTAISAAKIIH
jgi:hypothetical protein